jgi:hypothetical protein
VIGEIKGRNQNNFEKGEVYLAELGNAGVMGWWWGVRGGKIKNKEKDGWWARLQ